MNASFYQWLEECIQESIQNKAPIQIALTHRSYVNESKVEDEKDNERLEFLGDAVLGMVVTAQLIAMYPKENEGVLSKYRSTLVNEKSLSQIARRINLGEALLLGKGEEHNGGRDKDSILSDALEALIASVYLSNGIAAAKKFIMNIIAQDIKAVSHVCSLHDYKSLLQEYTLREFKATPRYSLLEEEGPDHHKTFRTKVNIQNKIIGVGQGSSKKESEQFAARHALTQLEERKTS